MIVENGATPADAGWRLGSSPSLVIGGDEADPSTQLFGAASATRLSSGAIAVGNGGSAQVLVFGEGGRRLRAIGRRGNGPGEFRMSLMRVLPPAGDMIVAEDIGPERRLFHFSEEGELRSDVRSRLMAATPGAGWWGFATSPNGASFALNAPMRAPTELSARPSRGTAALVRFTYGTDTLRTIARYPGAELFAADVGPRAQFGGGTASGPRPLAPLFAATAAAAGGGDPFIVAAGDQAQPAIDIYDEAGNLERRVRWTATGREPSARELELARTAYLASPTWQGDPTAARRALAALPTVSATPVFDTIAVDRTNHIWVERYSLPGETVHHWWVFDPSGVLVATVAIPARLTVLEIGQDYLLGLGVDDLDVERVEVWPLARTPSRGG